MKYILSAALILVSSTLLSQNTYYVSNDGSDNNTGLTPSTSLLTIDKVNEINLRHGDKVLFKKGNIFKGTIKLNNIKGTPELLIASYGVGEDKPIIDGSHSLKNWEKVSKNLWKAHCPNCPDTLTNVLLDEYTLPQGRFPNITGKNGGYLIIDSHEKKNTLTSRSSISENWEGGELVHRASQWIIDRTQIISQTGQKFVLDKKAEEIKDGWGFFIQNHLNTLDKPGEWYFDKKTKDLFLYFESNPNYRNISASILRYGIEISNGKSIEIKGIAFRSSAFAGVKISNSSDISLNNITVRNSGLDGIRLEATNYNVAVENSDIINCQNNAVTALNTINFTFSHNNVKNIGLNAGRGRNGNGQYLGLKYMSKEGYSKIENNRFDSIGYIGIDYRASNIIIRQNILSNTNLVKGDGGAIYTWNRADNYPYRNQKILSNIILNSQGNLDGTYKTPRGAYGIYMDDCAQNILIEGNTIAYCNSAGIFLHGTKNISLKKNTSYANKEQILISYSNCGDVRNVEVSENVFFCNDTTQVAARYETRKDDLRQYGYFHNNQYQYPEGKKNSIIVAKNLNVKNQKQFLTLEQWKKVINQDLNSTVFRKNGSIQNITSHLVINDTNTIKEIKHPINNLKSNNNVQNETITLKPFETVIVFEQLED